ncbi:sulfurtransferase [Henriciella aquimarina]|uniref:sulfurtransferase n=1 Tax=Henriciella aquimarina TaxID=545261 RepID=UPI000A06FD2A|nr:sulfurtransferase [Henriciella aquimarina]
MSSQSPLVSASWLKANINAPDLRILDASWFPSWVAGPGAGREAYERGHIPGAVYFDIDDIADPDSDLPHMLPDSVKFSSRVRKLGVGDGNRIVVYDANDFFASARVWWMFRVMGHKEVYVLDGGLRAWQAEDGEIEDLAPTITGGRHFTPRVRSDLVHSMAQVRQIAETGEIPILDARPGGRFKGTESEPRAGLPSGHIPGSDNVPCGELVGADGKLRPREELEKVLGDFTSRPAIASCGSGVSAAVIALALAELGNWDVSVYDGSWTEWASNEANPIETAKA